jgi:hypothetical protein
MKKSRDNRRSWWKRRSVLNVRNGRLVLLAVVSIAMGTAATLLTAYLGIR